MAQQAEAGEEQTEVLREQRDAERGVLGRRGRGSARSSGGGAARR